MEYQIIRTATADEQIRSIILYIAQNFGNSVALDKLNKMEKAILGLADNPRQGVQPRYAVLRRQGFLVLILERDLVFYKVDDEKELVTIYAVVDQRQDYLNIIRGI